ncbi:hypothetical protein JCM3766R1_002871, partial [Sporobolomyces carnicolor]
MDPSTPAATSTAPSRASSSASPSSTKTPATSNTDKVEVLQLSSSSSAGEDSASSSSGEEPDNQDKDRDYSTKSKSTKKPTGGKKRKASAAKPDASSSVAKPPPSKKPKLSSEPTTTPVVVQASNDVVAFRQGKLEHKQKQGPKPDVVASYMIGRAAFIEWAVEFFKTSGASEKLPEIPTEHLGAIAKDVQEASQLPAGLARFVRNSLAASITENMSALEDSQEEDQDPSGSSKTALAAGGGGGDEKEKKEKILERIDVDSLKKTIESLAERTNYGLSVDQFKDGPLPRGVTSIPT